MIARNDVESGARLASGHNAGQEHAAARLAELPRVSWKQALAGIVSPAIRLHHYRTAHNRVLQAALSARDCPVYRECAADE